MKWLAGLVVLAVMGAVLFKWFSARKSLTAEEAKALLEQGAVVVDVRSADEFARGHVEGARNIPFNDIVTGVRSESIGEDIPLVLYCASGVRSAMAASKLRGAGFRQVVDIGTAQGWPLQ